MFVDRERSSYLVVEELAQNLELKITRKNNYDSSTHNSLTITLTNCFLWRPVTIPIIPSLCSNLNQRYTQQHTKISLTLYTHILNTHTNQVYNPLHSIDIRRICEIQNHYVHPCSLSHSQLSHEERECVDINHLKSSKAQHVCIGM